MNALCAIILAATALKADEPTPIPAEKVDTLRLLIKPQPGEQRFWEIPWKLTITDARETAATEGKPILVWAGAGGAPIGVC